MFLDFFSAPLTKSAAVTELFFLDPVFKFIIYNEDKIESVNFLNKLNFLFTSSFYLGWQYTVVFR